MPTAIRRRRRRAKKIAPIVELQTLLKFVNTGVADYNGHHFDVRDDPAQEHFRNALAAEFKNCAGAAHCGAAMPVFNAATFAVPADMRTIDPLDPFPGVGDESAAEAWLDRANQCIADGRRKVCVAALAELCMTVLAAYLLHPRTEGFRLIRQCQYCERWLLERSGHQVYCSVSCRRSAEYCQRRQ